MTSSWCTDKPLFDLGYIDQVTRVLDGLKIRHQTFYHVAPDPTLSCIEDGVAEIRDFKPGGLVSHYHTQPVQPGTQCPFCRTCAASSWPQGSP